MSEGKDKYGIGGYGKVTAFLVNDEDKEKILEAIKNTGCTYRETKPQHVANEFLAEYHLLQYASDRESNSEINDSDNDEYDYVMDVNYPTIIEKREEFSRKSKDIVLTEELPEDFLSDIADKLLGFEKEEDNSVSALDLLKKDAS